MGINVALDVRLPRQRQSFAIEAFTIRAEARAALVAAGEMSLHEAVDGLQEDAERPGGLLELIDQDEVQAIMADAFGYALVYEHTLAEPAPPPPPIEEPPPRRRSELAASTIDALRYVVRQRDPERLRRFFKGRSPAELAAMQRLMVANDRKN
jgi:hypothetical protein